MKKQWKKLWMALLLLVMACSMTACLKFGEEKEDSDEAAVKMIEDAIQKLSDVKSMTSKMNLVMLMSAGSGGQSVSFNMNMEMESTYDPNEVHVKGVLSVLGSEMKMESYSVIEDNQPVSYTKTSGIWQKSNGASTEDTALLQEWQKLLDMCEGLEFSGKEDVGKDSCRKIQGQIDGKEVMKLINKSMQSGDVSEAFKDSIKEEDVDLPITFYVCISDNMPRKLLLNATPFLESAGEAADMKGTFTITVEYTGYNNVKNIKVPKSVKKAATGATNKSE